LYTLAITVLVVIAIVGLVVPVVVSSSVISSSPQEEEQHQAQQVDTGSDTGECSSGEDQCKNPIVDDARISRSPNSENDSNNNNNIDGQEGQPKIRMITHEELRKHVGENDGDDIWLSILGEVYDVTAGKDFYKAKGSYGAFSGTDCSLCFVSGLFSKEEAAKDTDEFQTNLLPGILDWRNFYAGYVCMIE
jgi:predicted heme/steroid binding protein